MFLYNRADQEQSSIVLWEGFDLNQAGSKRPPRSENRSVFTPLQTGGFSQTPFAPLGPIDPPPEDEGRSSNDKEKLLEIEKNAYEKGFSQGEKDGLELGDARAAKLIGHIEKVLNEIRHLKSDLFRQYEAELVQMVSAVAEKVVHAHLAVDETAVKATLLAALEMTSARERITIRMNPEDVATVESLRPEIVSKFKEIETMKLRADDSVTRGGCLLETAGGKIDAGIETQLETICRSLTEACRD